ncbi:MAG TPA: proline--tRNA ligase [Anaerolineales bacterium]|nr:proline--tRNA ligase [Anaerolineales bacterium]
MRTTRLFGQTLREAPADAEVFSHQLLIRAGFIRQLGAGIFSYLHLAKRSIKKIETIIREEMDAIGGQEISMPVVHPADIWKESKRWYMVGSEMGRFKDKNDHDMVLAMTHEEVVADLVRREIQSYKQLPGLIYHIQTKWRDDPRPRSGLIRVREFTMKDSYSLDADQKGLENQYQAHQQAYSNIFKRCGLPVISIEADTGIMGGSISHEYMYLTPIGEDTILLCSSCGYKANRQVAKFIKKPLPDEKLEKLHKVSTPGTHTIESLSEFLKVPKEKTAKAVFFVAEIQDKEQLEEKFVFALIRGDMDINETKLSHAINARKLRPATDEEIIAAGAVPGYASPVGLINTLVVIDDIIPGSRNLVSGANEEGYHLMNVNYPRDYTASLIADIASAKEGSSCPACGNPLSSSRGVEVANIFQLGTRYSEMMGCFYLDREGKQMPVLMGSYGIGIGRLMACIVEENHDQDGIVWPVSVSPFDVYLILLRGKGDTTSETTAENIYSELSESGLDVLFDDGTDSPGVKFKNADLIGCPVRITVSDRAREQGGVEVKLRKEIERKIIPMNGISSYVKEELKHLDSINTNLSTSNTSHPVL